MASPARSTFSSDDPVQAIRRFNRFYTRQIGVLQEHLLQSQFSLTEVRVLYEVAHRARVTAVELREQLGLDRGYLSRMLQNFEKLGWIRTMPARNDRRRVLLLLTGKGRRVFDPLDRRSSEEVAAMLSRLSSTEQGRMLAAMREIQSLLETVGEKQILRGLKPARNNKGEGSGIGMTESRALADRTRPYKSNFRVPDEKSPIPASEQSSKLSRTGETSVTPHSNSSFTLRTHRPGDMGWVVQRHGELYWEEYKYDERFEALVAEIVAEFIQKLDSKQERCWIAEKDGERVGTIFLVKKSSTVAKLRLLLVESSARGLGVGRRLVSECVNFAREVGYKKILLWTQSELHAARRLYEQVGFKRIAQKPHQSWGRKDLLAETWELKF
jgi:DNA-binding MarR family transcriptional regulator/GNAT superfamily N-acetyltransferase